MTLAPATSAAWLNEDGDWCVFKPLQFFCRLNPEVFKTCQEILDQISRSKEYDYLFRMLLIGDSGDVLNRSLCYLCARKIQEMGTGNRDLFGKSLRCGQVLLAPSICRWQLQWELCGHDRSWLPNPHHDDRISSKSLPFSLCLYDPVCLEYQIAAVGLFKPFLLIPGNSSTIFWLSCTIIPLGRHDIVMISFYCHLCYGNMPSRMGSARRHRFGTLLDKSALGANEQGHQE